MRYLLLCHSLGIGGTERQIINLARLLKNRNQEVTIAAFYNDKLSLNLLIEYKITFINLSKSGRYDLILFIIKYIISIKKIKPDVIYSFLSSPNILSLLSKLFYKKALIVWGVRSSKVDLYKYDWLAVWSYRIECWLSKFPDLIICNSYTGLEYSKSHGFPKEKMVVIHNGIDTEYFKPNTQSRSIIRNEWGIGDKVILIGLVARLDIIKDHPTFLKSASILINKRSDIRFICVGDGSQEYKFELHKYSQKLGLQNEIIWAGPRYDMNSVFNALDIVVSTSSGEGFSNTIAEAMACGVPCIVSNVGDSALIVNNKSHVFTPGNATELSDCIIMLINHLDPELKEQVRKSIINRFSEYKLVESTLKITYQLFNNKK
jgi:glycosyltransferase involved in cell wall biosynthesis